MKHLFSMATLQDRKQMTTKPAWLMVGLFMIFTLVSGAVWPGSGWSAESSPQNRHSLSDSQIAQAVEREIRADGVVPIDSIDLAVHEGVVTYTGKVDTLLAKERAARLAETVKGVRGVVNQLQVVPAIPYTDSAVKQGVIEELESDSAINPETVQVNVQEGVVTLDGHVESWDEKFITGKIVKRVKGVRGLHNNLVVLYKDPRSDADIKREIVKRLKYDVWVPEEALEVQVQDGEVVLSGVVGSALAKRKAFLHAWGIGVKDVDIQNLEVDPDFTGPRKRTKKPQLSPDTIREAVMDAILYDPRVVTFPEVNAKGGVVTLTGRVYSLQGKRAAEEDALNTVGVWYVRNYLKVRPPDDLTDVEIGNLIRDAWERNPYLTRLGMDITVFDGTAYLAGTVGSYFEKAQAEEAAASVKGVTKILNRLQVNAPWLRKPDGEIREDVEEQLWWSPFVESDRISVSVDNGIVTLEGTVDTWQERRMAGENAYEGGARSVHNKLAVENAAAENIDFLS